MAAALAWIGVALALVGGRFDVAAGGRAEVRGGQAPVEPLDDSEPAIAFVLIPVVGGEYTSARWEARLAYRPRLFWRFPNLAGLHRPLHLHNVDFTHVGRLARRVRWFGGGQLTIGEVDYTAAGLVFGSSQSAIPSEAIISYVDASAEESIEFDLARRHTLRTDFGAGYSGPLEQPDTDDEEAFGFTRTLRLWWTPRYMFEASRRDDLEAAIRFEWPTFLPDRYLVSASPYVQWDRQHTRTISTILRVGAMFVGYHDFSVLPAALGSVRAILLRRAQSSLAVHASAAVDPFVDVIRGVVEPRASLGAGLDATIGRDWLLTADATFSTTATRESNVEMDVLLDETLLMVRTPVRYRASSDVAVEFGTWLTARGPHLNRGGLDGDRVEIWGYVAVTGAWALRGGGLRWAP